MTCALHGMRNTLLAVILLAGVVPTIATPTESESAPQISLTDMLVSRFGSLSLAERRLVAATEIGETADCTGLSGGNEIIRGDLLSWLCANPQAMAQVTCRGISITAAKIVRALDLKCAKVAFPITASHCTFEDNIDVSNSHIVDLNLAGSTVTYLAAIEAGFEHDVHLNGLKANGGMDLSNAKIDGNLDCMGGKFIGKDKAPAFSAWGMEVKKGVFLKLGFEANGGVDLSNAKIDGNLDCSGGEFIGNDKVSALNAWGIEVKESVFLNNKFKAVGLVDLSYAKIGGDIELQDGHFSTQSQGALNLRGAKTGPLYNPATGAQDGWPRGGSLRLDGFVYERIESNANAKFQLDWLRRQGHQEFRSQPFEQLADVLRKMGLEEDAREVMIAKNEEHARYVKWHPEWLWYGLFGHLIGYGYSPWRAFFISLAVIVIGCGLFRLGYRRGLITPKDGTKYTTDKNGAHPSSDDYPKFNSFFYSLETFVPLVKLGIGDYWAPNANRKAIESQNGLRFPPKTGGWLRGYFWFHIIAGWVLSALWVGGITGLVKT
jgi:hypothetical protein